MNILQPKKLINYILIVLASFYFINCSNTNEEIKIVAIAKAVEIEAEGYYFSDEADVKIGGDKYSFRNKIEYDTSNKIRKLLVYHPEGALEYSKSDLEKDPKFFASFGYSEINDLVYKNGFVSDDLGNTYKVERIENTYLKSEREDDKVVFYFLDN